MDTSRTLSEVIVDARKELGLSQRALSRKAKVDSGELSRIETGKRRQPNFFNLVSLSEVLNLDLIELMKLSEFTNDEIEMLLAYKDAPMIESKPWSLDDFHSHSDRDVYNELLRNQKLDNGELTIPELYLTVRRLLGYSRQELADKLEMSESKWTKFETGKKTPDVLFFTEFIPWFIYEFEKQNKDYAHIIMLIKPYITET